MTQERFGNLKVPNSHKERTDKFTPHPPPPHFKRGAPRALGSQSYPWFPQLCFIYHRSKNTWMAYLISRMRALYIDTLPLLSTFTDLWITVLIFCETQTSIARRRNDFRLPLFKRNYGKQKLFYQCAKEWNILDASFKEINSLLLLKQNIKSCIF